MYSFAYFNSFIWLWLVSTFIRIVASSDNNNTNNSNNNNDSVDGVGRGPMTFLVLCYTFYPLQGFINFFVYTRPRYVEYRKIIS